MKKSNNSTDKVAIIDSTGIIDSSLTGVVAIRVAETLNKPTVLLQKRNDNEFIRFEWDILQVQEEVYA